MILPKTTSFPRAFLFVKPVRCNIANHIPEAATSLLKGIISRAPARGNVVKVPFWHSRAPLCLEVEAIIPTRCLSTVEHASCDNTKQLQTFGEVAVATQADPRHDNCPLVHQTGWDRMFNALKEFKSRVGDTVVPKAYPDNPSLGNWADKTRQQMRMIFEAEADGNTNSPSHRVLTEERIERLNSIGFVWRQNDHVWDIRFEELKEFKAKYGDTLVPSDWPQNLPLGQWVGKQRQYYQLVQHKRSRDKSNTSTRSKRKEKESIISADRIEKLNEIGFVWNVYRLKWFKGFEELKLYISNHGDALVPQIYPSCPSLGKWVLKQRIDYKRYMEKKKMDEELRGQDILDDETKKEMKRVERLRTGMTEERIRLLEEVGFIWNVHDYSWESKFEELCNFVALNGHAAIFSNSSRKYYPLAKWADNQRKSYKRYKKGKKTVLTADRIKRLNAVNFLWER